uniref:Zinc finger PHD-type domain-containing protein n=1 Tax=Spongospora subterranea TaxID=70186 RepID=A0A0H5R818_9EUKA|eukprot:CRZ10285.1 hypothetical protein [Spongospora subterranea]
MKMATDPSSWGECIANLRDEIGAMFGPDTQQSTALADISSYAQAVAVVDSLILQLTDLNNAKEPLYCICLRPYIESMIGCSRCYNQYHSSCLSRYSTQPIPAATNFICPVCDGSITSRQAAIIDEHLFQQSLARSRASKRHKSSGEIHEPVIPIESIEIYDTITIVKPTLIPNPQPVKHSKPKLANKNASKPVPVLTDGSTIAGEIRDVMAADPALTFTVIATQSGLAGGRHAVAHIVKGRVANISQSKVDCLQEWLTSYQARKTSESASGSPTVVAVNNDEVVEPAEGGSVITSEEEDLKRIGDTDQEQLLVETNPIPKIPKKRSRDFGKSVDVSHVES